MPNTEHILRQAHAELRFDVSRSAALTQPARERLIRLAGRRMTADGTLLIEARRHRTQEQNRLDALERFDELLRRALHEPKRRLATKATAASREKRLQAKKLKGVIKRNRQGPPFDA